MKIDLKELDYVQSAYCAGNSIAVLVDKDLTEEEFDEVYDLLYDEGIDLDANVLIEKKSLVDSKVNVDDALKFIVDEGIEIYNIAS